jgi:prepilin-type N-terminal cleavage/methylation domain-containing protein
MWLKRDERGLTLVEVLVAAVILGIVAVGLFATFDVSGRLAMAARQQTKAINLAQEKLEELRGIRYGSLDDIIPPKDFEPPVTGFKYGVAVEDNVTSKTVTVAVYYAMGAVSKEIRLTMERSSL